MLRTVENGSKYNSEFCVQAIDELVIKMLEDKDCMLASEFDLEDEVDKHKILFIEMYGNHKKTSYNIQKTGEVFVIDGIEFDDFKIIKEMRGN